MLCMALIELQGRFNLLLIASGAVLSSAAFSISSRSTPNHNASASAWSLWDARSQRLRFSPAPFSTFPSGIRASRNRRRNSSTSSVNALSLCRLRIGRSSPAVAIERLDDMCFQHVEPVLPPNSFPTEDIEWRVKYSRI